MNIRRKTAYLGLLVGVVLLVWAGFSRYPVQETKKDGAGPAAQITNINGYGLVREAARDGVGRNEHGKLTRRDQNTKDADTCYT